MLSSSSSLSRLPIVASPFLSLSSKTSHHPTSPSPALPVSSRLPMVGPAASHLPSFPCTDDERLAVGHYAVGLDSQGLPYVVNIRNGNLLTEHVHIQVSASMTGRNGKLSVWDCIKLWPKPLTRHQVVVISHVLNSWTRLSSITSWTIDLSIDGCQHELMHSIVLALVVPSNTWSLVPALSVGQPRPGLPTSGGPLQRVRKPSVQSMRHMLHPQVLGLLDLLALLTVI